MSASASKAVTVLGGYLGSGKTTLVNRLLAASPEPVVVLVNDFGDITVDKDLIVGASGDTLELANGCICCSMADGFVDALETIRPLAPERVVVEASGVADPASAAAYAHRPGFHLDAIVVTVDATDVRARIADRYVGDTVAAQIGSADLLVATKTDLDEAAPLDELEAWLRQRSAAPLVDGQLAAPEALFGLAITADPDRHAHAHVDATPFSSASIELDGVDVDQLRAALGQRPDAIVRAKGVLRDTAGAAFTVQMVGSRLDIRPGPDNASTTGRLIAIGVGEVDVAGWLAGVAAEVS